MAYLVADNELAKQAEPDEVQLATLLKELEASEFGLEGLGWDEDELEALIEELGMGEEPPEDPGPQLDRGQALADEYGTAIGQIWQCGKHRLAVGDCRNKRMVQALVGGDKIGAVVTDPPYGIERDGILNDDPEGLRGLYDSCLAAMAIDNAIVIAFQSPRLFWVWLDAVRAADHRIERMLWMYKPNDETYPWRGWLQKSEAIIVSTVRGGRWVEARPYAHDCYSPTTLGQELPKEWGKVHASVKPLSVVQDLVSRVGGVIYDPFLGSGTTMIACQRLERCCLGVELSPQYAAISLRRWEDLTGEKAVLLTNLSGQGSHVVNA